ncbi:ATP-binding protein [Thermus sp.]|uniref:sensor histidine kinase n=1 Tax=Thermus sp. TaxID=275 RepID=UPI00307E499C
MARALLLPLFLLLLVLWAFWGWEANRHLAGLLLGEARALLEAAARVEDPRALEGLGVHLTPRPREPAPLLGEVGERVALGLGGLEVWAARPGPRGAWELEGTYPLYRPSLLLPLLAGMGTLLWARARVLGWVRRRLGLPLAEAVQRLGALEAAFQVLEEGVAVLAEGEVVFLNPRALSLLGLPPGALTPLPLHRVWPALEAKGAWRMGEDLLPLPTGRPARVRLGAVGRYRVVVFQEQAEIIRLAEGFTQSRRHLELLRAQAHEFQNLLHAVGGLLELGRTEEALRLVQGELAAEAELSSLLGQVELPILAALLLGKVRRARERGVALRLEGVLPARYAPMGEVLASVVGNLLENALEAAPKPGGEVRLIFRLEEGLVVEVWDNGPGLPPGEEALFLPGVSGRGAGRGYGLALARAQARSLGGELGYHREEGWTVFRAFFPEPLSGRSS